MIIAVSRIEFERSELLTFGVRGVGFEFCAHNINIVPFDPILLHQQLPGASAKTIEVEI